MKTFLCGAITFFSFLLVNAAIVETEHSVLLKNISTKNIDTVLKDEDLFKVKKICSYEYCDYLRGTNIKNSMDIYIKKYLKRTPLDEEIKKTIYVKGLKITKVIYSN